MLLVTKMARADVNHGIYVLLKKVSNSKTVLAYFILLHVLCGTIHSVESACHPQDCVLNDWNQWGKCSEECGDSGIKQRTRVVLRNSTCGGKCNLTLQETQPCNRQCCPKNCKYTNWGPWNCYCTTTGCKEPGERNYCTRIRQQTTSAKCGGYCGYNTIEKNCKVLCCFQDCILGDWSPWSYCHAQCEQQGVRKRKRNIRQQGRCGGKICKVIEESSECMGMCCPVDCVQGEWSSWSSCHATCGHGNETRTRFVDHPKCYGKPCEEPVSTDYKKCERYVNVDCEVSQWAVWSDCVLLNGFCGNGTRSRRRGVLVDVKCKGKPCPGLIEDQDCHGPCCRQDCKLSTWTEWSYCSTDCGIGISERKRTIISHPACNGTNCSTNLLEKRKCTISEQKNCIFSSWSEWTLCDNDCGTGKSTRSRTLVTPAYCGGQCLNKNTEDVKECESFSARTDCKPSLWSGWSECVRNCGGGAQRRNRTIVVHDVCAGIPCSGIQLTVTAWSEWGTCQRDCQNGGLSFQFRNVSTNPVCGGAPCPNSNKKVRTCHEKCQQFCNQGICSCKHGFKLTSNGYSCEEILCKYPKYHRCPPGVTSFDLCRPLTYTCNQGQTVDKECIASCKHGFVVKPLGTLNTVKCKVDGSWTKPSEIVYCGPKNKPPLGISINATNIHESWPIGTCFAALTTKTDNEPNDRHTYSIVMDDSRALTLDGNRVCLKTEVSFEQATHNPFTVIIRTEDLDKATADEKFNFTILNENDPPRSVILSPNFVDENSGLGKRVGCLTVLDDDPGQSHKIYLVGSAQKTFTLFDEGDKKCVKVAVESDPKCATTDTTFCALDYEKMKDYYITVLVQDNGKPPLMAVFDVPIKLHDVNEKPWGIKLDPENIPEEVDAGQPLAKIVVQDEKGQQHQLTIVSDSSKLFQIKNGHLIASQKIDFEKNPKQKFTLRIKAIDNGVGSLQNILEVVFGVADINEKPYDLHVTSDNSQVTFDADLPKLKENTKDEVFGTVTVYDDDIGDVIEMTVKPSEYFKINNKRCSPLQEVTNNYCKADLVVIKSFNYEETQSVSITVMVRDKEGLEVSRTMILTIIDTNDKPSDVLINGKSLTELSVAENTKSAVIATLHAVDEDVKDTHRYQMTGTGAGQFIIQDNQIKTSATAALDYEANSSLELILTVEDSGKPPLKFQKTITLKITNVNEPPSDVTLNNNKVSENSPAGTVVGTLSADDPDNRNENTQTITFKLTNDAKGRFLIKGDNLQVATSSVHCGTQLCTLDFQKEPELKVVVRATDNGHPELHVDKVLTIWLEDANDAPANIRLSGNTIRENLAANAVIGTLSAEDKDINQIITFELKDKTDLFGVRGNNELVSLKMFNFEKISKYSLKVRATDNGQPPAMTETTVEILVTDMNEPPEFVGAAELEVAEDATVGTVIGKITVQDPDHEDYVSLSLSEFDHVFGLGDGKCDKLTGVSVCVFELKSLVLLDYNKVKLYSLALVAEDHMGVIVKKMYSVKVQDINHPPEDILLNNLPESEIHVDENVANSDIASLSAKDKDEGQTHTFTIVTQQGDFFSIDKTHLKLLQSLDFEKKPKYDIELKVIDSGLLSVKKNITVFVININEAPTKVSLSVNKVKENSAENTLIGTLTTQDPDNTNTVTQTFSYTLVNNAENRFKIDTDKLVVGNTGKNCESSGGEMCSLNFEKAKIHHIEILVSDSGMPSKTARFSFQIDVTDVNDPPHSLKLTNNKVEELAPAGTVIGEFSVEDEDVGQTHTFTLLDDSVGQFSLTATGTLTKAKDARLDSKVTYKIAVRATDSDAVPKHVDATFYIAVTGTEEAPKDITISPSEHNMQFPNNAPVIKEDASVGDVVGIISAFDMDLNEKITFEILDGGGHFTTNSTVKCLKKGGGTSCSTNLLLNSALDFELEQTYSIVIRATDKNGLQSTESFTVKVSNVNEPPTDLSFSGGEVFVEENSKGKEIGAFLATDPDAKSSLTFTLTLGYPGLLLSKAGLLSTSQDADIDFESNADIKLKVKVTDEGGLYYEKVFPVRIGNVNEIPTEVTLSNNMILEMSPSGVEIGQLIASDPDKDQSLTLTLQNDAGGRFKIEGIHLKTAEIGSHCKEKGGVNCLLDYESSKSHDIIVKVTDNGRPPLSNTSVLTIVVLDANDRPSVPVLDGTEVSESAKAGSLIGTLHSEDQDSLQSVKFSLAAKSESTDWFSIDGKNLRLKKMVDFEDKKTLIAKVVATDNGKTPLTSEKSFVIRVKDEEEPPSSLSLEPMRGGDHLTFPVDQPIIKENEPEGTVIGQLVVTDPDFKEEVSAASSNYLVSLAPLSCLTLTKGSRCTGELKTKAVFDFETKSTFSTEITVTDRAGLQLKKIFNFTIQDENDPPQDILVNGKSDGWISVEENSADITVARMEAVDSDKNQQHTFAFIDGPQSFYFVGHDLKITSVADLDYEKHPEYIVIVKVTDSGQPPLSTQKQMTIKMKNVNEKPISIHLTSNEVAEASVTDTLIGSLITEDPDNVNSVTQTFTYSLTDSNEDRFHIKGDKLLVKFPKFDFELQQKYFIKVKVTDSGSPPLSSEFELKVLITNSNDPPTNLKLSANTVLEDAKMGSIVGTLSADDYDRDQTVSFSMASNVFLTIRDNRLVVNGQLDFETVPSFKVIITAQDNGNPPLKVSKEFLIEVVDTNDRPSILELVSSSGSTDLSVVEGTKVDTILGKVMVCDPDHLERITLDLLPSSSRQLKLAAGGPVCSIKVFKGLNQTVCTSNIVLAKSVDFEEQAGKPLVAEIKATDKGKKSITDRWEIQVIDTNDPPTDITIDGDITEIPENEANFLIGTLETKDEDRQDKHTYQLITFWEIFRVQTGGKLVCVKKLDYEQKSQYDVVIKTVDSSASPLSFTKTFHFTVKDVNEQPTNIALSPIEVSMAAKPGSTVGFLEVTDPDNKADRKQTFTCSVSDSQEMFTVNQTTLTIQVDADLPKTEQQLVVSVTCVDSGEPAQTLSQNISINVKVNADVPKAIKLLGTQKVLENKADVDVGKLVVVNALNQQQIKGEFKFMLLQSKTKTKEVFNQFAVNGMILKVIKPLDFEEAREWIVTIQVTGTYGENQPVSTEDQFTIIVIDVNEPPTHIGLYTSSIPENSPPGTLIGDLNTKDSEKDQTYIYKLLAVAKGVQVTQTDRELVSLFRIMNQSLVVGEASQFLNFELSDVFSLKIESVDSGEPHLSYTGTVHVLVEDSNDPPTNITLDNDKIAENSAEGTVVGRLSVADEDQAQSHTCEVVNIQQVPFKVKDGLNLVVSRNELDYEGARKYVVEMSCQDEGADRSFLKITKPITIHVTNVNEPPHNISLSKLKFQENGAIGQTVAEISSTDLDSNKVTYTIDDSRFAIEGDNTLIANMVFDYEVMQFVSFKITATDIEGLSSSQSFTMEIEDLNEAPSKLALSGDTVQENAVEGTEIGTLRTEDPDREQTFTYSLTQTEMDKDYFAIKVNKLVTGSTALDYESKSEYTITITTSDSGNQTLSKQEDFVVKVKDINEPPTKIILNEIEPIPEDTAVGHVLTTLHVEDEDVNQKHSCHVTDDSSPFSVKAEEKSMSLVLVDMLNYETAPEHKITLSCSDGQFDVSKVIAVTVVDVNEKPTAILLDAPLVLPAMGKPGFVIGNLAVKDPDKGQIHTFSTRGPNSDIIQVKDKTKLTLIKAIPAEQMDKPKPELKITIYVVDNGQPSLSLEEVLTFPITGIDVEALKLPDITISDSHVNEDAPVGTVIGALYNINQTVGDNVIFSITEDESGLFEIKDNSHLVLARSFDGVSSSSITVTIQARNMQTQQISSRKITIFIRRSVMCNGNGKGCDVNAKCVKQNDTFELCQCLKGFTGDGYNCTNVDDCLVAEHTSANNTCQNGGKCVDEVGGFSCECKGFSGPRCEIDNSQDNVCVHVSCLNGGVCSADKSKSDGYSCVCKFGWTGKLCGVSVDDCVKSTCYAGGTCIDKHRTYVCRCPATRTGIHCEYITNTCTVSSCSSSQLCVPKVNQDDKICVTEKAYLVILKLFSKKVDLDEFKARFIDFVSRFGRFPRRAAGTSRRKRSSDTARVYVQSLTQTDNGKLELSFVVMDPLDVGYTTNEVLDSLDKTCLNINSADDPESQFCPAIQAAVRLNKPASAGEEGGGLPLGMIAGGGGGGVAVIIIIIVVVVCIKKKKKNNSNQSTTQEASQAQTQETTASPPSTNNSSPPPAPQAPPPTPPPAPPLPASKKETS